MTHLVAVDLAAKNSAACWIKIDTGEIVAQWDSWQCTEDEFVANTTVMFSPDSTTAQIPAVLVLEDLPHGVPYMKNTKAVLRLQGRFGERLASFGFKDRLRLVSPAYWRKGYPGMQRGTGPDIVVPRAAERGYTPPDLSYRCSATGDRTRARKVQTDYCAAWLIAQWLRAGHRKHGHFDFDGLTRYTD